MATTVYRATPLVFLLVLLSAGQVQADTMHPYADPLLIGEHSENFEAVLDRAFKRTVWTLVKQDDSLYVAKLSSRGIDIELQISLQDEFMRFNLGSVTETGCTARCKDLGDEDPVLRWLVSLRRTIAYELTLQILDDLQTASND